MQLGRQFLPTAAEFDHVFSKKMKRNRVELVSDFPNDAEVISSLQVKYVFPFVHKNNGSSSVCRKCLIVILKISSQKIADSPPWLVCA